MNTINSISVSRDKNLVETFVNSMIESIRSFAGDKLSEEEIKYLAEREVNRLDFNNEWQMHKGLGYFAKRAVNTILKNKK